MSAVTRRTAVSTLISAAGALWAQPAKRTNVLFIVADDLNTILSVYGNPLVRTPNLERLARRGVTFDRAYCQYPLCQPSRASFLSGMRPETTRVWTLETPTRQAVGDAVFLPELFRKNGYFTAHAGKVYHTGEQCEDPRSWDLEFREFGKTPPATEILKASHAQGPKGHSFEWDILKTQDAQMPDGIVARKTVEWLEKATRERSPFFIGTGFRRPHAPYAVPKKYFDLYPPDRMPLTKTTLDDFRRVLPAAVNHDPPDRPLTDTEVREQLSAWYASVSFVDAQLGLVLDALDRLRLWDDTAVVFFGDNGYLTGEHGGMWHKNSLFEPSARIPLLIAAPGARGAGRHSPRLAELVDLYPTLAGICGLTPPSNLEGTSLRPLLDSPELQWKKAAFTMQGRGKERTEAAKDIQFLGKSLRTERWRYTEWDNGKQGIELYDEQTDPQESVNLAGNPKHAGIETELKDLLHRGWRAALPQGQKP